MLSKYESGLGTRVIYAIMFWRRRHVQVSGHRPGVCVINAAWGGACVLKTPSGTPYIMSALGRVPVIGAAPKIHIHTTMPRGGAAGGAGCVAQAACPLGPPGARPGPCMSPTHAHTDTSPASTCVSWLKNRC